MFLIKNGANHLSQKVHCELLLKNCFRYSPYSPTPFLRHHVLQTIYELASPEIHLEFQRERVYFMDGGHVSLDWLNRYSSNEAEQDQNPIVLIMHGMTGGSNCKYIRILAKQALVRGYTAVCLNSRGINSHMTSPIPFVGMHFHELKASLKRIRTHYPFRPIHLIGTSLGGNYLLRFLLNEDHLNLPYANNIESLTLISSPFDVGFTISNMNLAYQRYFIKYYISEFIEKHPLMNFWKHHKIVDFTHLKKAKNLTEFHQRITTKILGIQKISDVWKEFAVNLQQLDTFKLKTLILMAKDDPMVAYSTLPESRLRKNANIEMIVTESGGHLCWFEGIKPERWYPKPVFEFIDGKVKKMKI